MAASGSALDNAWVLIWALENYNFLNLGESWRDRAKGSAGQQDVDIWIKLPLDKENCRSTPPPEIKSPPFGVNANQIYKMQLAIHFCLFMQICCLLYLLKMNEVKTLSKLLEYACENKYFN